MSATLQEAWRAIMSAAGLVPTFHRSPVFGLRMPWATFLILLIVGVLALAGYPGDRYADLGKLGAILGIMLLLPAFFALARRVARLAKPETIHLVPGLRRDATFGLVSNGLLFSLLLAVCLSTVALSGHGLIAALIPICLLSLVSDLPPGRLKGLLWMLIFPTALCAVWIGSATGMLFGQTDSFQFMFGVLWSLWMVFVTTLGMVGLLYVKPLATIMFCLAWVWLMRDPVALPGFNFNAALAATYTVFTQPGTHTLTAIAALGALWYWLIGRGGDGAFDQRRTESKVEGTATGALDLAQLAPSSWLLLPYRSVLRRVTASISGIATEPRVARLTLSLALGPSLHWVTLVALALGASLIWTGLLLALPARIRGDLVSGQVFVIALLFAVMLMDVAIKQYGKRKQELDLLSLTPMGLSGQRMRTALVMHAAGFVSAGIVLLMLVVWVPRLLFGGPVEIPIRDFSDLLSLAMIGVCVFSLLMNHLLPTNVLTRDPGLRARAAIVFLAIMPLILFRVVRVSIETQVLVQLALLAGWGLFAWRECRRLIRARPVD